MINTNLIRRSFTFRKNHSLLNITGLAIGMACTLVIIAKVEEELSYDKYLPDADRIYRLTFQTTNNGNTFHFARCWENWVSRLPARFPQIAELVRLAPYRHTVIKAGDQKYYTDRVFATDSNFFDVFNIKLIRGNAGQALREPFAAVLSESYAKKFFGDSDPVGKTIQVSGEQDEKLVTFNIKGIMTDSPVNSHIHFDVLTSFEKPAEAPEWAYVYLLLKKKNFDSDLLRQLPAFIREVEADSAKTVFEPFLQKITDIHLHSDKDREVEPNGNIAAIYLFILVAVILLTVSWTNYFNLGKARLILQGKTIDIQRMHGARNLHLILQSVAESSLCTLAALLMAIIIIDFSGAIIRSFFGFNLMNGLSGDLAGIIPFLILISVITVIAGSLPVIIYITVNKVSSMKKEGLRRHSATRISSYGILLAVQFFLAAGLIISAITIFRQKELILSTSIGKQEKTVMVFKNLNWHVRSKYRDFRVKALQNPFVREFTASLEEPTGETLDAMKVESSGIDPAYRDRSLYLMSVEDNFVDFFNIPLVAGNNFRPYDPDRKGEDYILNERAVKELGWTPAQAIGKPFKIVFNYPDIFYGGTVVGVVKDFHFNTLRQEIKPYVLFQKPIFYLCFIIEVDGLHRKEAIEYLRGLWENMLPDYPFEFEYIDDLYGSAYRKEFTQAMMTGFFSILAVIIICMGLYAITSLLVARMTKEIGIRKACGAGVSGIIRLLTADFTCWFTVAFLLSCPVAFLIMNRWLSNFAYHVKITWWTFVLSGIIVLSVSLITVIFKSFKAATINPVEALRYE